MKAVLLRGYGDVEQFEYADVPEPIPEPGEVLVKTIATSINPIDYKLREGEMKSFMPLQFPAILGRDIAGEVVKLGPGVDRFKTGDYVMGMANQTYAEFVKVQAEALNRIPERLNPSQAGALPLVITTGAQLSEKGVEPKQGEVVLVTGAAGSVGRSAVYTAKQAGAIVIAGVKASQKEEARNLGADQVVALDRDDEIASLPELDAIADTVNGETIGKLVPKLKKSGRLASVLGKPEAAEKAGIAVKAVFAQPDAARLYELAEDVRDGKLKIPIGRYMRLYEMAEAHRVAQRGINGKVVITP